MKAILIDSDIFIEVSRGRDAGILADWNTLSGADVLLLCSPVTVAEIWHGARASEHSALNALFTALTCVPIDADLRLYAKSHGVELGDALIAATASIHGLTLWTRNRKHYPMRDVSFY